MTAQAPHIARLLPFERADLLNGDIPMFTTRPDSRAIYASRGETIDDFLAQPSLEMTRQLILQFDENDLKRQLWFIEASFATTLMEREQPAWKRPTVFASTGRAATPERLLAAARAIGDHLCDLAIHDRRGASWVGLALLQERQWMLNVVPPDLYNGSLGITLFLSYLGAITGETRYTEIAQAAYVTLDKQLEQMKDHPMTVGAFDGWGAMIYLLAHLGVLWHDPTCFSDAEDIVRLLPDLIAKDQMFDVISGSAGCILSLASLYHVSPSPALLETMKLCGERLKETAQAGSGGKAWQGPIPASAPLTGFSHGAAGCMLALLTLAELSGDERFRQPALGALDYERSVFSPPAQNWPDFRVLKDPDEQDPPELADAGYAVTWCHGAPGIGLSRLAALRYLDNEQIREEIRVALNTTIKQGFGLNHSLCHGDLGNLETLLLANQLLPDARYSEHLKHFSGLILDSIEVDGWLTGIPLGVESPGLMTGLAGIGYELLRLAVPERVPSVLLLAPPPLNHT